MNEHTQKLLAPVSDTEPCGPDCSYDPQFDELEALLKGKPEVEMGEVKTPAKPPEWRELKIKSTELLGRSKHLRVAIIYSCSLLKTEGLTGFSEGLQLIRGLLEQRWAEIYPRLDPSDNNDPTQRLNILGALNSVGGPFSGWLSFVDNLYTSEIARPKGSPPVTFRQLIDAEAKVAGAADATKLTAAIRGAGSESMAANFKALQESVESVKGIDQFLTTTLGAGNTISFDAIEKTLQALLKQLEPLSSGGAVVVTEDGSPAEAGGPATAGVGISVKGSIRSRDDVIETLDRICDYYAQVEPGSPVPFLIKRARTLVKLNFVEALHELSLATVDSLRPSMGSALDSYAQSSPDASSSS